ncbi:indolethylamine N-methyltransferase-like isoform X1 [Ranitomeya imitator]|uniref:indolethylamine N-methyltransferase-like isoform X1 n=1 Tax=Ranitomeya imitator TaxID=111125 RepID=UPI0037E8A064
MDSSTYKRYHEDGYDSRQCLEHYFSDKPDTVFAEDSLVFPIENLLKTFTEGHIKGDILIELSPGSMVHHLFAACEFFKHIIVLKARDRCIMELKRWVDERTGAFDWRHATKLHVIGESSDLLQDKEGKVRSALQHVVKCDFEKENMMDPIKLPLADCTIIAWLLDLICKDQDDFMRYLRRFSKLLKPEGHFILIGCLEMTYYTVGKDKFHAFNYNKDFARNALVEEGFVIDCCNIKKRRDVSDLTDYKAHIFIAAHKEK